MQSITSTPVLDPLVVEESRILLTTRLLRLTDGNTTLSAQIRGMMWANYCDQGAPLGVSEDGMYVWWADALDSALA